MNYHDVLNIVTDIEPEIGRDEAIRVRLQFLKHMREEAEKKAAYYEGQAYNCALMSEKLEKRLTEKETT